MCKNSHADFYLKDSTLILWTLIGGEKKMNRMEKLRNHFHEQGIDGLLITSSYNRQYMTQFSGTAGVALISEKAAIFITDFRYMEQAKDQAKDYEIVQHTGPIFEEVAKQVEKLGLKKVRIRTITSYI